MVSLPGTMKREGRQAMLRGALGVRLIQIDDDAFPEKLLAATTDRRILLFEQSMFARAKELVADSRSTRWPRWPPPAPAAPRCR